MQKFTIFTVIFSIAVMAVVAELVMNNYVGSDVIATNSTTANETNGAPSTNDTQSATVDSDGRTVTADLLTQAGFIQPVYKETVFSGLLFSLIDLSTLTSSMNVVQGNIFTDVTYAATATEFTFNTPEQTDTFYQFLQEKAASVSGATVNVTNTYSEGSFYLNSAIKTKTAFLVVKKGLKVYAFEYPHRNHGFVTALIGLL